MSEEKTSSKSKDARPQSPRSDVPIIGDTAAGHMIDPEAGGFDLDLDLSAASVASGWKGRRSNQLKLQESTQKSVMVEVYSSQNEVAVSVNGIKVC